MHTYWLGVCIANNGTLFTALYMVPGLEQKPERWDMRATHHVMIAKYSSFD